MKLITVEINCKPGFLAMPGGYGLGATPLSFNTVVDLYQSNSHKMVFAEEFTPVLVDGKNIDGIRSIKKGVVYVKCIELEKAKDINTAHFL